MLDGRFFLFGLITVLASVSSAKRIWSIHVGPEWGGHEYLDSEGYLKGFAIGFIDLVCSSGQMDCRIVLDAYDNCWTHNEVGQHPSGGRGLMSNWYDGCLGWVPTVERIHTLAFSMPYIKQSYTYFYVYNGKQGQFNPRNVAGKTIIFMNGWASNEQCLARQTQVSGRTLQEFTRKAGNTPSEILTSLRNGTADAFFGSDDTFTTEQRNMLHRFDNLQMSCYLGGNGLMARKDSGVIAAWNVGFAKLREGNKFNAFCEKANAEHKLVGTVDCINF